MVQQSPPIKNAAHTFYIGLPSVANSGQFQNNPTIAAGDFQVSKDGGAFSNLGTLPTATGKMVEVTLSATEMDADNIVVLASDQAGGQWGDVLSNIQTEAGQLSFTSADAVNANMDRINGGTTGSVNLDRWARAIYDNTADSGSTTTMVDAGSTGYGDDYFNGMICIWRSGVNIYTGRVITDYVSSTGTFTFNEALPNAVASGDQFVILPYPMALPAPTTAEIEGALLNEGDGQALLDAIINKINTNLDVSATELGAIASAVRTELTTELGRIDANISTRLATSGYTSPANSDILAIKNKTDDLVFTKANELDVNIQSVNDVTVTGTGSTGDEWGP